MDEEIVAIHTVSRLFRVSDVAFLYASCRRKSTDCNPPGCQFCDGAV